MLKSLYIKNFRCLKEFEIKTLKQVNLITGKNNTGKSTILEALAIYASNRKLEHIIETLKKRGEYYVTENMLSHLASNTKTLSALFTGRNIGFKESDKIIIGEKPEKAIILSFKEEADYAYKDLGFQIDTTYYPNHSTLVSLNLPLSKSIYQITQDPEPFLFVQTGNNTQGLNGKLFDNITLTDREKYVIDALKIIEPLTERIAFVLDDNGTRSAVIKLSNSNEILPLQSMGDGINRILTIILAVVNSKDYLLIDEFENGLHYSVQEKLWKIILLLSENLNIQVFATTHSNDAIYGFEKALNATDNKVEGKLIRLDNKKGTIKEVEFLPEELLIAEKQNIEIR